MAVHCDRLCIGVALFAVLSRRNAGLQRMRVRAVGEKGIRTRCLVYPWSLTDYLPIFSLRTLCLSAKDKTTTRTTRDNKKVVFGCLSCLLYKEQGRGGTRFVASVPMRRVGTRALPHDRRRPTSDSRHAVATKRDPPALSSAPLRETKDRLHDSRMRPFHARRGLPKLDAGTSPCNEVVSPSFPTRPRSRP